MHLLWDICGGNKTAKTLIANEMINKYHLSGSMLCNFPNRSKVYFPHQEYAVQKSHLN